MGLVSQRWNLSTSMLRGNFVKEETDLPALSLKVTVSGIQGFS